MWKIKNSRRLAQLLLSFGVSDEDLWAAIDIPKAALDDLAGRYNLVERMPFFEACYEHIEHEETA